MNDWLLALRSLRRQQRFTVIAVLTLTLGVAGSTAMFSVLRAVLLKPLSFPDPDRLVVVGGHDTRRANPAGPLNTLSFPEFFDLRSRSHSFAHLAAYRERTFALTTAAAAQSLYGQRVTGNFFTALGVEPLLGRTFTLDDERPGGGEGGLTVVLSHDVWRHQFNGDPSAIGRTMILDGLPFSIVGVLPSGFRFPIQAQPTDIYVSIAVDGLPAGGQPPNTVQRTNRQLRVLGRLRPQIGLEQARPELHELARVLAHEHPTTNTDWDYVVRPLDEYLVTNVRDGLWMLTAAVVLVLLMSCVNVAGLLLARASVRRREIAVRLALGAPRWRILKRLLIESVLLSMAAGVISILVVAWSMQALVAVIPQDVPRAGDVHVDAGVLVFTLTMSLVTAVAFGLAPAFLATRVDVEATLRANARAAVQVGSRSRAGHALIVFEVALALVLLVAAGVLFRSLVSLARVNPGFETDHLLSARIALPDSAYPTPFAIAAFHDRLESGLASLPGVRSASAVFPLPLSGALTTTSFDLADHPLPSGGQPTSVTRLVGADYFRTMGIPLMRGRYFTHADRLESRPVVVINERFAQQYFSGLNPIGRRMTPGWSVGRQHPQVREIVGVVGNAKHLSLRDEFVPELYVPLSQVPYPTVALLVRTEDSTPTAIAEAVRGELSRLDPKIPLTAVRAFDEYRVGSLAGARFNVLLLSMFAAVALTLTAVGIYGVIAYAVSARTRELGVRLALGARPSALVGEIVWNTMRIVGISLGVGLVAAVIAVRLMHRLLFGIEPWDPATLVVTIVLLGGVALLASAIPARRAAAVDPMLALRAD